MFKGINIIGPVFGEFGIGEDVRKLAQALLSLNLPISIISYPETGNFVEANRSLEDYVTNKFVYQCNIFCMPLIETYRFFSQYGLSEFESRCNIAYAPWELEDWPKEFSFFGALFDEVWASSLHTLNAYKKSLQQPIYRIPLIVENSDKSLLKELSQKIRIDRFKYKFLYVFDSNSTFSRKNPQDVIRAFQKVLNIYPDIALILKTMNYQYDDQEINKILEKNSNIILINDCLSRSELLGLYDICDAYISLHKAEGFGRTIAEAMLLKKPTIVSNYSGNTDFCTNETSFLVDGKLEKIAPYAYPFWQSNRWFSPDLDSAARQMLQCVSQPDTRSSKVEKAHRLISESFSNQAVSKKIDDRLKSLSINS